MPTNGKTIIKDAVAVCSYLSDYGVDQGNAIASTHSYTFDEKTPWDVIREVADACQTSGGAVGFDGYVDPPGNLWIFPRNSSNSTVDLTDKIIRYKIDYDTYRVKNKITVYGREEKNYPNDKDSFTESITDWTKHYESQTLTADSTKKIRGSYSIKSTVTASDLWIQRNNIGTLTISDWKKKAYKTLNFWWYHAVSNLAFGNARIYLMNDPSSPDAYNSFWQDIPDKVNARDSKWTQIELKLGPIAEAPSGTLNGWIKYGNPSWDNIQAIRFVLTPSGGSEALTLQVDELYFGKNRFSGSAEDATSQTLYGVRMPEPITDESLASDEDCTKKAQSLLSYYKDRVTTLTLTTFGDNNFKPGDRLHVVLSNDGIDDYFRILEVRHTLEDVLWQTELLLSNEPIMIDYVFRKMFEVQKNLATNQRS